LEQQGVILPRSQQWPDAVQGAAGLQETAIVFAKIGGLGTGEAEGFPTAKVLCSPRNALSRDGVRMVDYTGLNQKLKEQKITRTDLRSLIGLPPGPLQRSGNEKHFPKILFVELRIISGVIRHSFAERYRIIRSCKPFVARRREEFQAACTMSSRCGWHTIRIISLTPRQAVGVV